MLTLTTDDITNSLLYRLCSHQVPSIKPNGLFPLPDSDSDSDSDSKPYGYIVLCSTDSGSDPYSLFLHQVRIQDLVKGGAPASEAESCQRSGAESCERSELSAAGVQGPLKGPGSF